MSRLAGFKILGNPPERGAKSAKSPPATFLGGAENEVPKGLEVPKAPFGTFGTPIGAALQEISPCWEFRFADGGRYLVEFDPPISGAEILATWEAKGGSTPIQIRPAAPPKLSRLWNKPRPPSPVLRDVGIDVYEARPEFALTGQIAAKPPNNAIQALEGLGYAVTLVREAGEADSAVKTLLGGNWGMLGIDVETMPLPAFRHDPKAGLDPYKGTIRLIQIADPAGRVYVFDMSIIPPSVLTPLLATPFVAHNAGFEYRFLKQLGIPPAKLHCTYLQSRIVEGVGISLAIASQKQLGIEVDKTLQRSNWGAVELSPDQIAYAALDAVLALRLWDCYAPQIKATGQAAAYRRFAKAIPIIGDQMLAGIGFNTGSHKAMMQSWRGELEPLRESLDRELGGINPDSPQQLAAWLAKNLDPATIAAWPKTPSGQLATGADILAGMDHPAIATLKRYSELTKQLSTFGVGYASHIHPVTGRIHAEFTIAGTRGGRFNCRNPNLQNPPRDPAFRGLFTAREGYQLIVADYSQIELRIAALIAKDSVMLEAYRTGADLHTRTAAIVAGIPESQVTKGQRQLAKACNFGLVYGMGAKTLAAYAKAGYGVDMSQGEAERARNAFFKTYAGIKLWHLQTQAAGLGTPQVRTRGGLLRDFAKETGFQLTTSLNTPVQGSGAECLVESITRLPGLLSGLDCRLIHQVHDELILECVESDVEAAKVALVNAMEQGFTTLFPEADMPGLVEAHAGGDWNAAKG